MQFERARYYVSKRRSGAISAATSSVCRRSVDSIRDNSRFLHTFGVDRQRLALSASVGFPMHPGSRKRDPISEPRVAEIEGAQLVGSASPVIRA
jgi:hypothetical protein